AQSLGQLPALDHTYTHTHTYTITHTHTHAHTLTHTYTHTHPHTHTRTPSHIHTHPHTHPYIKNTNSPYTVLPYLYSPTHLLTLTHRVCVFVCADVAA